MIELILPMIAGLAILAVPVAICYWLFKVYQKSADHAIASIYQDTEELHPFDEKSPSTEIVYHTYSGVLVWVTQREHRVLVNADQGIYLLKRLRNYNLKWGFVAYGLIFIPALALFNYWSQLKVIRKKCLPFTDY